MMREGWHEVSKGFWQKQFGTHVVGWAWTSGRWQAGLMGRNFASGKCATSDNAMLAAEQWVESQTWPVGAPDAAAAQAHREAVDQATSDKLDEAIERVRDLELGTTTETS